MGIFGRLASLIKSNLNDLISKSEDPEKMLNQVILEMNTQLMDATHHLHLAAPAAPAQHEVEVGGGAAQQGAVHGHLARKGQRLPAPVQPVVQAAVPGAQLHAVAIEQHDAAIHAGEGREWPGRGDGGHAHAPLEALHARARRPAGQLARVAAAVLPGGVRHGREVEGVHGQIRACRGFSGLPTGAICAPQRRRPCGSASAPAPGHAGSAPSA